MSILNKLNKYSAIYLFNAPNTLNYTLFNFLYNKFIINLKDADHEIKYFHENGYFKPNLNFKEEINQLNNILDTNNVIHNQHQFKYNLTPNSIEIIKKILNSKKFVDLKNKIEKYFNLNMYLIDVKVARNFPIEKKVEHKKNLYSNNYHVDYYIMNFFKMFINLHDVDDTQGPMNIFSKKNSKKFIKLNDYRDRSNYNTNNAKELGLVKNTGSVGDLLVCSTPQCLHRATSPDNGKHRDMLFLSFAVTNENNKLNNNLYNFENSNFDDIWSGLSDLPKKLSKPKSFRATINIFSKLLKNKII